MDTKNYSTPIPGGYRMQLVRTVFGEEQVVIEKYVETLTIAVEAMRYGMYLAGPGVVAGRISRT